MIFGVCAGDRISPVERRDAAVPAVIRRALPLISRHASHWNGKLGTLRTLRTAFAVDFDVTAVPHLPESVGLLQAGIRLCEE